jgi:hypothetical protein
MARDPEKRRASNQAYRERNREAIRARDLASYAADETRQARAQERARSWAAAHPGKVLARTRAWREANRETIREQYRTYREAHHAEIDERSHAYRDACQAETLEQARRRGYRWTGPELELAARRDLTTKQVALMLGRTSGAVYRMRSLLRDDPETIALAGISGTAGLP